MRRLFIIRKDLHLKPGKLAAMIGHCTEAFWTNLIKASTKKVDNEFMSLPCVDPENPDHALLYRHEGIYKMSCKAFLEGKKSFLVEREDSKKSVSVTIDIPKDIWEEYVNGIFTKTICECKNLNQLKKAEELALEQGLVKGVDFGYINDSCKTDLCPENVNGTCTVGIWFRPLPDDVAHSISKKFQLYRD